MLKQTDLNYERKKDPKLWEAILQQVFALPKRSLKEQRPCV